MNIKALQVTTEGEIQELNLGEDSLGTLQSGVGGWVQAIDLTTTMTLWCNEEGKLESLPHNPYAQKLWDVAFGADTDYIVGDVVLTGGVDDEGMTLGLNELNEQVIRNVVAKVAVVVHPGFSITMS